VGCEPTDPADPGLRLVNTGRLRPKSPVERSETDRRTSEETKHHSSLGYLLLGALDEEAITVGLARSGSVQLTPAQCNLW